MRSLRETGSQTRSPLPLADLFDGEGTEAAFGPYANSGLALVMQVFSLKFQGKYWASAPDKALPALAVPGRTPE